MLLRAAAVNFTLTLDIYQSIYLVEDENVCLLLEKVIFKQLVSAVFLFSFCVAVYQSTSQSNSLLNHRRQYYFSESVIISSSSREPFVNSKFKKIKKELNFFGGKH